MQLETGIQMVQFDPTYLDLPLFVPCFSIRRGCSAGLDSFD